MELEIIDAPIRFRLHGKSAAVPDERYGEVGMQLMDDMWKVVREAGTATTGINHWVYLLDGRMFVGIELQPNVSPPEGLESLQFELQRYLKHLHVGSYHTLPAKWKALTTELAKRGESGGVPSLEIYGHHCADPLQTETTILIRLRPRGT